MPFDPDAPAEGDGLFGLPFTADEARVVVLPVPWQATTSYRRGTRGAPKAVLEASRQVDLHDLEYGDAWRAGIAMLPISPDIEAWDLAAEGCALRVIAGKGYADDCARVDALSAKVNAVVHDFAERTLADGRVPAVLGGDHSVPFGAIQAAAGAFPGLGILHVDAHADLRVAYEGFTWSHASILHNVATRVPAVSRIVQVGIRDVGEREVAFARAAGDRIRVFDDFVLGKAVAEGVPWARTVDAIVAALPHRVWVTFDIDGLDPALCPGTGTPVPGGLDFRQACALLAAVAAKRRIVGFDLNEVGTGAWDAIVGARVLYKLCGAAITSG
jgi:agmatinase